MKYARKLSFLLCGCYIYNYWGRDGEAGVAVGQGTVKRVEGNGNLSKKNCYQLCLFLFINNVDRKNSNRNYRKPF